MKSALGRKMFFENHSRHIVQETSVSGLHFFQKITLAYECELFVEIPGLHA
jgi:hypothetical protein